MEWLEDREFYELMQTYRHASPMDQAAVIAAFEAVKQIIRDKCEEREEWPDSRRAARLCDELGHAGDTVAALEHMKRMEVTLKVLHTWAAFPPMDVREVRDICVRALKTDEAA